MQTEPPGSAGERLLFALATGRRTSEDIEQVWSAAQSWLESGCTLPIHRFLRVPATPGKLTEAARNIWLCKAARLMDIAPQTPTATARELHRQIEAFISRGPWVTWSGRGQPPADASELRTALFHAVKFNAGQGLSERQIYRLLTLT